MNRAVGWLAFAPIALAAFAACGDSAGDDEPAPAEAGAGSSSTSSGAVGSGSSSSSSSSSSSGSSSSSSSSGSGAPPDAGNVNAPCVLTGNAGCDPGLRCECEEDVDCTCQPGPRGLGSYGERCTNSTDCASGFCVDGPADPDGGPRPFYCTQECESAADCTEAPLLDCSSAFAPVCISGE